MSRFGIQPAVIFKNLNLKGENYLVIFKVKEKSHRTY